MKPTSTPPADSFQIRCPRLGHQIHFSYCRQENLGTPCGKTLDCWYPYFPVAEYLRQELSDADWQDAFEKPVKPKLVSLVDMLEEIKKKGEG